MENIKISPGFYSKNISNTLSSNKIIEKVCIPSIGTPSSNKNIEKVCSPVSILNTLNSNKNIEKVCAPVCTPISNLLTYTETGQENIKLGKIKSDQDLSIILKQFKQEILMYIGKKIDILHDDIILHNKYSNR